MVLYWGKAPRRCPAEPERDCLDFLDGMAARVREVYRPGAAITLIFTDTHAKLNGHPQDCLSAYFDEVELDAGRHGFHCCRLGELPAALNSAVGRSPRHDVAPADTLQRLSASARRWYRGKGTPEQGALDYYRMNMIEKRAVELAFPRSIFITFNGSELRSLFRRACRCSTCTPFAGGSAASLGFFLPGPHIATSKCVDALLIR